jgi:hypothetical protein
LVGRVLRLAADVYRAHAGRVLVGVLAFLVLPAVVQSVLYEWLVRGEDASGPLVALTAGLIAAISSVGVVIFAGFLDVVVDHHTRGSAPESMPQVVRRLPLVQLLAANLALSLMVGAGLAVLVIPGLILLTWYCLVGPMLVSGGATTVPDAFRRSHALMHGHFWLVFVLVTVPLSIEHWLVHAIDERIADASVAVALAVSLVIFLSVNATVGLVEVALAVRLREAEPAPTADT